MKTTPTNPHVQTIISYHLSLSFNIKNAKIVVKNGFVKKRIVAYERVSNLRAVKAQANPIKPANPLIIKYLTSVFLILSRLTPTIER